MTSRGVGAPHDEAPSGGGKTGANFSASLTITMFRSALRSNPRPEPHDVPPIHQAPLCRRLGLQTI
jgi:hypothetical protein